MLAVYYWYAHGILAAIVAFVLGGISVFLLNLIVLSRYVWRGFSPLAWGLTHTEVQCALDSVIKDPRWQADPIVGLSEHEHRSGRATNIRRLYTYEGKGISTKLRSAADGKKYIVSTAPNPNGYWELAVFRCILGFANVYKPLRVAHTDSFAEAEEEHSRTEEMVMNLPLEEWQNW